MNRFLAAVLLLTLYAFGTGARAATAQNLPPPIEVYGNVPSVRDVALSDSGNKIALLRSDASGDYVSVKDIKNSTSRRFQMSSIKPRDVDFIGERFLLLRASATTKLLPFQSRFEYGFAYILDIKEGAVVQVLGGNPYVFPGSPANRIAGVLKSTGAWLVPARTYLGSRTQNLSRIGSVKLDSTVFSIEPTTGNTTVYEGQTHGHRLGAKARATYPFAIDWIIRPDGSILAREDYNSRTNEHRIYSKARGEWQLLYENDPSDRTFIGAKPYALVGAAPQNDAILLSGLDEAMDKTRLYRLDLNGDITDAGLSSSDREIKGVLTDDNKRAIAVAYDGLQADYHFFDQKVAAAFSALTERMSDFNIEVVDWSRSLEELLLKFSASGEAGTYYAFDVSDGSLAPIARSYAIPPDWVGQMQIIEYRATDGLTISAVVTWPPNAPATALPTIVLPHGGPHNHDGLTFDWLAQYFASRGYLVLQPNFRGSTGFGDAFKRAGYGAWGRAMQTDIHRGLKAIAKLGWADPKRACIVGSSYGGYAALAGAMTEPDLFKCVVAIAPVTDLPDLLADRRRQYGSKSYTHEFWLNSLGNDKAKLVATSPARNAARFSAPVLLIHGKDDTVVPFTQTRKMYNALKRAKKPVELLTLPGEDHWLSTSKTRLSALKAAAAFVEKNLITTP